MTSVNVAAYQKQLFYKYKITEKEFLLHSTMDNFFKNIHAEKMHDNEYLYRLNNMAFYNQYPLDSKI